MLKIIIKCHLFSTFPDGSFDSSAIANQSLALVSQESFGGLNIKNGSLAGRERF
jgi:hypothetical protein